MTIEALACFVNCATFLKYVVIRSMDECEAICNRIGIMVSGQFRCMGTVQHLKNKFGKGFSITFKLTSKEEDDRKRVEAEMAQLFPGCVLNDYHEVKSLQSLSNVCICFSEMWMQQTYRECYCHKKFLVLIFNEFY